MNKWGLHENFLHLSINLRNQTEAKNIHGDLAEVADTKVANNRKIGKMAKIWEQMGLKQTFFVFLIPKIFW